MWINLKKEALDDPKVIAKDVSNFGHWDNGEYQIVVKDTQNLEYIMSLIKQAI
jgi:predicted transport protein